MGLKLLHLNLHGLIRGHDLELGRDSDTGGQTLYVLELVKGLAASPLTNSKTYKVCPPVSESLPSSRSCERIKPCKFKCKSFNPKQYL